MVCNISFGGAFGAGLSGELIGGELPIIGGLLGGLTGGLGGCPPCP